MIKANAKMRKILNRQNLPELAPPLCTIIRSGFTVKQQCYFLSNQFRHASAVDLKSFYDEVGFECYVNSIHIEDYVKSDAIGQSLTFISCVFEAWRKAFNETFVAILSVDGTDVIVKFHLKRSGQQWLSDNINGYEEAVLEVDSSADWMGLIND